MNTLQDTMNTLQDTMNTLQETKNTKKALRSKTTLVLLGPPRPKQLLPVSSLKLSPILHKSLSAVASISNWLDRYLQYVGWPAACMLPPTCLWSPCICTFVVARSNAVVLHPSPHIPLRSIRETQQVSNSMFSLLSANLDRQTCQLVLSNMCFRWINLFSRAPLWR